MKTVILGAGMTGLAAGIKTGALIYEASDKPGGICRSYYQGGYRFENGGGHWIFGADDDIMPFIQKYCSINEHSRDAGIYFNQIFPYPIQNIKNLKETYCANSFKEWLQIRFGDTLCGMFFWPFNKKYTAGFYDDVLQDDPAKSPRNGTGYNDTFVYPQGGLDAMVDKMAEKQNIHYSKKAIKIDSEGRVVTFSDGEVVHYDRLISTIPLKQTLKLMGKYENDLPHTSVLVLNIGAERGPRCPKEHWLYIPDPATPFYRVGFYSNVDPSFAPAGKVGLYVERAFDGYADPADHYSYAREVIQTLTDWGWIKYADVINASWIPYGYTWLKSGSRREEKLAYLKSVGIDSIGRYGAWRFCGISESILQGLSA